MNSVISYPDRGPFGKSSYRGNCSGHVIKDLIAHFQPTTFLDVCEGSGTSRDVCKEMGVEYYGLDLHRGFDFTRDSALLTIGKPVDMCFSHPPYHDMIDYRAERKKHGLSTGGGNDISACGSVDEFIEFAQLMLLNQREATNSGAHYATLIGDMRSRGMFHSFQSDFIKLMPRDEHKSVTIKMQHNTVSQLKGIRYPGSPILIQHEYLLIWQKSKKTLAQISWDKATELHNNLRGTWKNFVHAALMTLGGEASLDKIYSEVEASAGDKLKRNPNHRAKIRQILQHHFHNVERGRWALLVTS